jgi:hypothetical protein
MDLPCRVVMHLSCLLEAREAWRFATPRLCREVTVTYCGSPIPRHETRSFQSLKRPAGFDFQVHTWIW